MHNLQKTLLARYQYDALDRLTVHDQADRGKSQRFYCEGRLSTEIQGGERHSIFQHVDQLLAQQTQDSGGRASTLLATDLQRSVLNVIGKNDTPVFAYSPYGHRPFEIRLTSLLGFNGQWSDPVSGDYLLGNGYRAFNPALMRFNSPDNLSPFGEGGMNFYAYCGGDPINRSDPSGHIFRTLIKGVGNFAYDLFRLSKRVYNVKRYSKSLLTFEDHYKGGTRLTISAHGNKGGVGIGGESIRAEDYFEKLSGLGINFDRYDSVRTLTCFSATPGRSGISVAQALSDATNLPVKGFLTKPRVGTPESLFRNVAVGQAKKRSHHTPAARVLPSSRNKIFYPRAQAVRGIDW